MSDDSGEPTGVSTAVCRASSSLQPMMVPDESTAKTAGAAAARRTSASSDRPPSVRHRRRRESLCEPAGRHWVPSAAAASAASHRVVERRLIAPDSYRLLTKYKSVLCFCTITRGPNINAPNGHRVVRCGTETLAIGEIGVVDSGCLAGVDAGRFGGLAADVDGAGFVLNVHVIRKAGNRVLIGWPVAFLGCFGCL